MVRFAILGFGFMGKKHLAALEKTDHSGVFAIIDHTENTKNSDFDTYQSLDFFLASPRNIDVVIVSTPQF